MNRDDAESLPSDSTGAVDPEPRVDLHSHVLPGLDDGAQSDNDALEMLRIAADDGTQAIAATPHAASCDREEIPRGVARLNRLAVEHGLDIVVLPGSEERLAADLARRFAAGDLVTLNETPYLLLELPFTGPWPPTFSRAVYELQLAGAWPVLAHAERCVSVQRDPLVLADAIEAGVVIQINADSLTGPAGSRARQTAELLVRARLAHVVASDAHGPRHRPPRLSAALDRVAMLESAESPAIFVERAARIRRGEPVTLPASTLPDAREPALRRILKRLTGQES